MIGLDRLIADPVAACEGIGSRCLSGLDIAAARRLGLAVGFVPHGIDRSLPAPNAEPGGVLAAMAGGSHCASRDLAT